MRRVGCCVTTTSLDQLVERRGDILNSTPLNSSQHIPTRASLRSRNAFPSVGSNCTKLGKTKICSQVLGGRVCERQKCSVEVSARDQKQSARDQNLFSSAGSKGLGETDVL